MCLRCCCDLRKKISKCCMHFIVSEYMWIEMLCSYYSINLLNGIHNSFLLIVKLDFEGSQGHYKNER